MKPASPGDILRSLAFYMLFYGGSICLALLSAPLPLVGPKWAVTLSHWWTRWQRWLVRNVLSIEVRIEGPVPSGAVLVVGKHESMFEAIDLPCLLHMPVPFAKVELLELPLWGRVGREYGVVPVERDKGAKALRAMLAAASHFANMGRPLAIFPEGTRVPHGERPALQAGFAGIYKLLALPVVPFAVNSGPLFAGRWKRRGVITYRFGETIPPGLPRAVAEARVHAAINVLNPEVQT